MRNNQSQSLGMDDAGHRSARWPLYPLQFVPVYKEKIWGGAALARLFGRQLPSQRVGESWEVAAHPHGQSIVKNGPLAGLSLVDLLATRRPEIMGRTPLLSGRFPLLVKLLDCNDWLSVQVHPDDEYARTHEGELGKQESWVVLWAAPEAQIVYGLRPGTTREQFAAAIAAHRVEEYLNQVHVRAGDVFSVPAGTLHALGRGVVVAEIQQNSDTVYRVYDWQRLGDDGQPRELHVAKALDVIRFAAAPAPGVLAPPAPTRLPAVAASPACGAPPPASGAAPAWATLATPGTSRTLGGPPFAGEIAPGVRVTRLDANPRYIIERVELDGPWRPQPDDRFFVYMLVNGAAADALGLGPEPRLAAASGPQSEEVPGSELGPNARSGTRPETEPEPQPGRPVICHLTGGGQELDLRLGDTVLIPAAVAASGQLLFRPTGVAQTPGRSRPNGAAMVAADPDRSDPRRPGAVFLRAYVPDPGEDGRQL